MLPSSPSQLARYGHMNHYKKFWLLQTQLEKQEQAGAASSSASLSLQGSPAAIAASHASYAKESSSRPPSLVAQHGSGDYQAFMAPQYAISRTESSSSVGGSSNASCSGSRIMAGIPAAHSSMNLDAAYANSYSFINLRGAPQNSNAQRDLDDRPRLSLAVYCENVADVKPTVAPSGRSFSLSHTLSSHSGNGASEAGVMKLGSSKADKQTLRGCSASQTYHPPSRFVLTGDQSHGASELCIRPESNTSPSKPLPAAGAPNSRTCTLCGTSRTPLWRSGPSGPKSLCNACGIRVKKTKRLEAALQVARGSPSMIAQFKGQVKRKHTSKSSKEPSLQNQKRILIGTQVIKEEVGAQNKIHRKSWVAYTPKLGQFNSDSVKRCAIALAEDVEEAAVGLMALSCGLVPS